MKEDNVTHLSRFCGDGKLWSVEQMMENALSEIKNHQRTVATATTTSEHCSLDITINASADSTAKCTFQNTNDHTDTHHIKLTRSTAGVWTCETDLTTASDEYLIPAGCTGV